MSNKRLKKQIKIAAKQQPADILIKNGKIVDVFNAEIIETNIAIADEMIVGIGNYTEGKEVINAEGYYICPGLIDAHVHIESSLVTPSEYAKTVVPRGVTTVITDPHEIANVLGKKGIEYILNSSKHTPLEVYVMLPSSVPASPHDCRGAVLTADDLEPFFDHPRVKGLAEVMDFPAVKNADEEMLNKILLTLENSIHIDGHAAGLTPDELNIYRTAQIRTDHENVNAQDALEQIKRGMYVIMREGSATKDLINLLPAVTNKNSHRFLYCSDDKEIDEIIRDGSIDYNVRLSIKHGLNPITAIQIATLNAAKCYHLNNLGAIAPGYQADMLFISDLEKFRISKVYKKGVLVSENNIPNWTGKSKESVPLEIINTINMLEVTEEDLSLQIETAARTSGKGETTLKNATVTKANVIGIIPNSLYTEKLIEDVNVSSGFFVPSVDKDQLKIVAAERHHRTGKVGVGIVKGFQIKRGAMAATLAHDSHNIISVGSNDSDIIIAINHLREVGGGLVVVKNGNVIADLQCPIAGLISLESAKVVNKKLNELDKALLKIGINEEIAAFQLMSFLSLPVIPSLKLTCNGLFDVTKNNFINVGVFE